MESFASGIAAGAFTRGERGERVVIVSRVGISVCWSAAEEMVREYFAMWWRNGLAGFGLSDDCVSAVTKINIYCEC